MVVCSMIAQYFSFYICCNVPTPVVYSMITQYLAVYIRYNVPLPLLIAWLRNTWLSIIVVLSPSHCLLHGCAMLCFLYLL
jgi:hypothetical protein